MENLSDSLIARTLCCLIWPVAATAVGPGCGGEFSFPDDKRDGMADAFKHVESVDADSADSNNLMDVMDFDGDSFSDGALPADATMSPDAAHSSGPAGTCGTEGHTNGWVQNFLGAQRYYFVRVPQATEPLPAILVFHGDGVDPDSNDPVDIVLSYWAPVQNTEMDFILVGMKCPSCASWLEDLTKSEQYMWDVFADLSAKYNIDVSRVYLSGYSGGANMLARRGLKFQGLIAGIHFNCGGGYYGQPYNPPPRSDCAVDVRFVVSESDFLWSVAKNMESFLLNNGHHVDFIVPSCSGHCCYIGPPEAQQTWNWFKNRTKCGDIVGGTCADISDLP